MARSFDFRLPTAILVALGLMLAVAAPALAAPAAGPTGGRAVQAQLADGEICGSVTAYTAPTPTTPGSITINGTTDPIAAGVVVDATLSAALSPATAAAPVTACLTLTVDNDGTATAVVTGLAADASVRLCGPVSAAGTGVSRVFTVSGALLPPTAIDANVTALLNAAAAANASVCLDVTASATTGAITAAANLDAEFQLCGQVAASGSGAAREFTVAGVALAAAQLSAAEIALLELALLNRANVCVQFMIVDSAVTSLSARADVCVTVSAATATSVTLDGVAFALGAGATVAPDVRAGQTLAVTVAVSAADVLTISVATFPGCTAGAVLPDTAVGSPDGSTALTLIGLVAMAGAVALAARRRGDLTA